MTLIALVSAKGSPGVTTTTLALASAWATDEPSLVAEVDPDGGDIAALTGLAVDDGGLLSLSVAARHDGSIPNALRHCQYFGPLQLPVLVAPVSPAQTISALDTLGTRLARSLEVTEHVVFADCGRFRADGPTMTFLAEADVLLLVARPTLAQAEGVATRLEALRSIGPHLGVLLVGDRPYSATEFSAAVGADIAGVVDFDRRGAEAIVQAPGSLLSRRSLLTRSVSGVADGIRDRYFTNVGADW